jgi:2'-5' RNA ligase
MNWFVRTAPDQRWARPLPRIDRVVTREQHNLEQRWQAFQQLSHLTEHWYWRPGWAPGRSFYTWHLTFEHAAELHRLVHQLQADLTVPALDLVPPDGLHLTMQGIGFVDEVADEDIAAIVEAARKRSRSLSSFDLALGPVDPDSEGIGLLVNPWAPVERVRLTVREAIADVWGTDRVPEPIDGFRPHVTVAYSAADGPADELRKRLAQLRTVPPVAVVVDEAQLIRLNRDEHIYRWDTVASVPFAT